MKVCLALDYKGVNQSYHMGLWTEALRRKNFLKVDAEKADVIVQWGVTYQTEFDLARSMGKPVLIIDFPYWNRAPRQGREYYKISLNGQHPTPYIMQESHDNERLIKTRGYELKPWREGGEYILVAGMGHKAAAQHGYKLGQWEEKIIDVIRKQTDLPIVYRPKPNRETPPIHGTVYDDGSRTIEEAVEKAYCVACHHGNPTIAALARGVPIFMNGLIGAAAHLARHDFSNIHDHFKPERQQFFNNLAHWQFSVDEIKSGSVFTSFRRRGFI